MIVRRSKKPDIDLPHLDLLSFLFASDWPLATDDTKLHIEAANPSNHITKAESRDLTKRVAHVLRHQCGIGRHGPGKDVVLTISSGSPFLPVLFYGVVAAGGVLSGVGTSLRVGEMVRQVQDANAKVIICSREYAAVAANVATECGIAPANVLIIDSSDGGHWSLLKSTGAHAISILKQSTGAMLEWERITDQDVLRDTTIALLYSSGTTGLPKGVRLSHQNIIASCICSMDVARRYKAKHADFQFDTIAHLPFANIAGIDMYCMNPIYMGGSTYWMKNYEYRSFIDYHKQFRPAYQFTVPPIWLRIAKDDNVTDHFDALQVAITGSAPIGTATVREIRKKLGEGKAVVAQTWGITEATGVITAMDWGDPEWSVGDLCPNIYLRIISDDGHDIEDSKAGEMLLGGPFIAQGYHNKPEATKESFVDGWYHTGDIGMAEEHMHYIVDRKKELIKYKGQQVAPAEIEAVLTSHERIADAAVIGIWLEDQDTEVPRAYVVKKDDISAQEILAFVKYKLASYKQLRGGVIFVDQIPKSASGKILRKELRDKARGETIAKL